MRPTPASPQRSHQRHADDRYHARAVDHFPGDGAGKAEYVMSVRADLSLIPGMGLLLMILLIMLAFQLSANQIALPVSANADTNPPAPSEVVLRVDASGRMKLTIDDEWGTSGVWGYYSLPQTREELGRELRRLFRDSTENRVITLKADSTLRFGTIEQIVVAARDADVRVIRVVVETK